jgi:Rps23 Pro-64 3,4-dihydroxylase Tpa1-like proline 4-hydroxylase
MISNEPFFHVVVDNFFDTETALKLSSEFFSFDDPSWLYYDNPLEKKKTMNHWNNFPRESYRQFTRLCSEQYIAQVCQMTGINRLYPDIGLHGGGWHLHGRGQKLNIHKDYSIHPKLGLERKLNLIVYLTPDWNPAWGGGLELWSHNSETNGPGKCVTRVECVFNRAVLFDTTQNSWHGLPTPIDCPEGVYRKSMAVYYLTDPEDSCEQRQRALYAPTPDQVGDQEILQLIEQRSHY